MNDPVMSDRSEPVEGEPEIEIRNHFQLRILMKHVPEFPGSNIGKLEPVLQYRARHKQSQCWTKFMDVIVDIEGETPSMFY